VNGRPQITANKRRAYLRVPAKWLADEYRSHEDLCALDDTDWIEWERQPCNGVNAQQDLGPDRQSAASGLGWPNVPLTG
jgi:hypothetical protein